MFGYLKIHLKRKLVLDAQHRMISKQMFKKCNWSDFYRGVEEAIPRDIPNSRGNAMLMHGLSMRAMGVTEHPGDHRDWYTHILQQGAYHYN